MPSIFTKEIDLPSFKTKVSLNTGLFIDGEFVDAADGQTFE